MISPYWLILAFAMGMVFGIFIIALVALNDFDER